MPLREPATNETVLNLAAYHFAPIEDLAGLRGQVLERCLADNLRGTVLISHEGINLFVAGEPVAARGLIQWLRGIPGLEALEAKESWSAYVPFNRMLVRIKKEIIAFGIEGIEPARYTSRRLPARELKRWLDEGRPVTLLDTRNDYEVEVGTFEGAIPIRLDHFRDFPAAVEKLPAELRDQPVVTFCTGGIRCEKAAPFMEKAGFRDIYQLEGGILKYFEECGGAHYRGDCFVFDQRVAVDAALKETDLAQCYACQAVLSREDRRSPQYRPGESCPHCYQPDEALMQTVLADRQRTWNEVTRELPASQPHLGMRPIHVAERYDGLSVIDMLEQMLTVRDRADWQREILEGRLLRRGEPVHQDTVVRSGDRLEHLLPEHVEPEVSTGLRFLYEDEALVVLDKPAPLPIHPGGRYNRHTLVHLLDLTFKHWKIRPAHRLDANTCGLLACARTRAMAARLQPMFQKGEVKKAYRARVVGHPPGDAFDCQEGIARDPGPQGRRQIDPSGDPAFTRFQVVKRLEDGTSLLEVEPVTGRTNQIRLHLWHLNLAIVGDPLYLPNHQWGARQTLSPNDPPLHLQAFRLAFRHPLHGKPMEFELDAPSWWPA